jgi:hypothetical protein
LGKALEYISARAHASNVLYETQPRNGFVHIRSSTPDFDGVALRMFYDVAQDKLRLEAFGENTFQITNMTQMAAVTKDSNPTGFRFVYSLNVRLISLMSWNRQTSWTLTF